MSSAKERLLALTLLGVIFLVGGGFLFYTFFWSPIQERETAIASMRQKIQESEKRVSEIEEGIPRLKEFEQRSLPADIDLARREYEIFLNRMLRDCGFDPAGITIDPRRPTDSGVPTLARNKPAYTRLEYIVHVRAGTLDSLLGFMEDFYQTNVMHQITKVSVLRLATESGESREDRNQLKIDLTVEAVVLDRAEKRDTILPDPEVPERVVLARDPRNYQAITSRDVFFGPPAVSEEREDDEEPPPPEFDASPYIRLTSISFEEMRPSQGTQALQILGGGPGVLLPEYKRVVVELFDRANKREYQLVLNFNGTSSVTAYEYVENERRTITQPRNRTLYIGPEGSEERKAYRLVRAGFSDIYLREYDWDRKVGVGVGLVGGGMAGPALPGKMYFWHVGEDLDDLHELSSADGWAVTRTPPGVPIVWGD